MDMGTVVVVMGLMAGWLLCSAKYRLPLHKANGSVGLIRIDRRTQKITQTPNHTYLQRVLLFDKNFCQ